MALEGETIATGARPVCEECGVRLSDKVLRSAVGYYIGTECNCGPYSRESGYYTNETAADTELKAGTYYR